MQALSEAQGCQLDGFEINLIFSAIDEQCSRSRSHTRTDEHDSAGDAMDVEPGTSVICLVGFPAPSSIYDVDASASHERESWKFWSNPIADEESGLALTARWAWEARSGQDLQGRVWHGGLVVQHPCEPIGIACHVKGTARKSGFRLKFTSRDKQIQPRI